MDGLRGKSVIKSTLAEGFRSPMSDTVLAPVQPLPLPPVAAPTQRLLSLDALRGFDMFWIVGGDALVHALYKACPVGPLHLLDGQMDHKAWAGVAFYDLIFPLFVFMLGVSVVFSLSRTIERHGRAVALKRIVFRSLILYTLGLIQYGGLANGFDHIRWTGVLQRLAICYLFAGTIFCTFRLRGMIAICVSLLLAYCALLTFVPVRDFNLETKHLESIDLKPQSAATAALFNATTNKVQGRFDDGLNLTQHIDYQYLPGRKWDGAYDPEGILSTLPAIATCLLGVFAGLLLRNQTVPDQKKVLYLLGAGVAGVALGFLWGLQFPVIKKIWTSSYVLVAGGYACLFLGAFYQIVEIWQCRKWCTPFVWIGMNPITIYLAFHLVKFDDFAERVVGGPVQKALGTWGNLLVAVVVVAMMFAFVRFLYQRKLFLRL
jgi:predicted acyltransferase